MEFSATGNLLSGSFQRPDMVMVVFVEKKKFTDSTTKDKITTGLLVCRLNRYGRYPIVSTITGLGRALLGLVHTIVHLVCAIFSKNREYHLQEAVLGMKNIRRGLIEAIPLIGNLAMFLYDLQREKKFENMALQKINEDKAAYRDQAILFVYGQEIAKCSIAELDAEGRRLNKKLSAAEIEQFIRTKAKAKA